MQMNTQIRSSRQESYVTNLFNQRNMHLRRDAVHSTQIYVHILYVEKKILRLYSEDGCIEYKNSAFLGFFTGL